MSFFRNIRTSISRGKSSSRDTTPVRGNTTSSSIKSSSSRPASIVSNAASSTTFNEGRRDSIDSRTDSILNRGETFILNSDQESEQKNHSNNSTLEKKSKKSKVLSKFSTFTKRKKTPTQQTSNIENVTTYEHHPSDNATNTYYKWNTDGTNSNIDYDAQTDPFNFLYEQHSNLKLLQNGIDTMDNNRNNNNNNNNMTVKNHGLFDSSTYRKGKASTQLKAQLEQLKNLNTNTNTELNEEEHDQDLMEDDKYKTVTLNSFRKSFRDKYLQQQHEAPHNPSWFVEVDKPNNTDADTRNDAKENRPDYLVFENENYRPGSRSPVRDRSTGRDSRNSRSNTRSPVKRNETFRVERSAIFDDVTTKTQKTPMTIKNNDNNTSIHIEFKNSVMPHSITGRIVPVGVAKPMPSTKLSNSTHSRPLIDNYMINANSNNSNNNNNNKTPYKITNNTIMSTKNSISTTTTTPTNISTQRNLNKSTSNSTIFRPGKYQTLVQISNDNRDIATKLGATSATTPFNRRSNRASSTRIQLGGGGGGDSTSPLTMKFNNNIGSRYSYAAPMAVSNTTSTTITTPTMTGLTSYELLKNPTTTNIKTQQQRLKQTYFGDDMTTKTSKAQPTRLVMSPSPLPLPLTLTSPATFGSTTTRTNLNNSTASSFGNNNIHNFNTNTHTNITNTNNNNNINYNYINTANAKIRQHQSHSPKRSSSTVAVTGGIVGGYMNRRDLHQPRFMPVTPQRRSRSPIKIPWR